MLAKGIFRNLPFRVCCHLDLLVVRPGYPGHSLRLLLSEGDPRVGPVVGSGLYVPPPPAPGAGLCMVTHIRRGNHVSPTLHPRRRDKSWSHKCGRGRQASAWEVRAVGSGRLQGARLCFLSC